MMQPATSGVALPDRYGSTIRAWKIVGFISLGAAIAGMLSSFVFLFVALYQSNGVPVTVSLLLTAVLAVLGFTAIAVVYLKQTAQRNDLADALTLAGHPGVDALRLQSGRPVPSPQGVELRLRTERDGSGARWLLVDAYAYAPPPPR